MTRLLDEATTAAWARVVDDHNPLHVDAEFAAKTRFAQPIAHGSLLFALVCDALQTTATTPARSVTVRFRAPVPVGSAVEITASGSQARVRCDKVEPVDVKVT